MTKIALRWLAGIAAGALVIYAADYAILRYRIGRNRAPYDTVVAGREYPAERYLT